MARIAPSASPRPPRPRVRWFLDGLIVMGAIASVTWALRTFRPETPSANDVGRRPVALGSEGPFLADDQRHGMVRLGGGPFRMGDDFSTHPDQRPGHQVSLRPFWIDRHEVTNRQFAQFVEQTDYITTAEARGWSFVFDPTAGKWRESPRANWRRPGGEHTSIQGRDDYPVAHISWYDAEAYARHLGRRLPTEAEWEYAARAGLRDAPFPWGAKELLDGRHQANYWQGWYPDEDLGVDGFRGACGVGSYPASQFGLYDMSGNVWEWCGDWYDASYYAASPGSHPPGPTSGAMRVQRGGSWQSAENNGQSFRVTARSKRPAEASYQDVGFRCASDQPPGDDLAQRKPIGRSSR